MVIIQGFITKNLNCQLFTFFIMQSNFLKLVFFVFFSFYFSSCAVSSSQLLVTDTGIFDGKIGKHKIILIVENVDSLSAQGYFVYNRNRAVEKPQKFTLQKNKSSYRFQSENIEGIFSGTINEYQIDGTLKKTKNLAWLFFWKNRMRVKLEKRDKIPLPDVTRFRTYICDEVTIEKDIVYGRAFGYWTETPYADDPYVKILGRGMINILRGETELDLKLDVYTPQKNVFTPAPLVMLIHGGGFYIGNKQTQTVKTLATEFARRGYVVASIDYRMGFNLRASEIERSGYRTVQDVHAALRYLSHNADKYGIDPSQVYVAGASAGGVASLLVTFLDNNERPESTFDNGRLIDMKNIEQSGNDFDNTFEIKAVGNMWGAVLDTNIITQNEKIPVISFHGTADKIVPYGHERPFENTLGINRLLVNKMYGSESVHQRLNHLNIKNKLISFDGKGHEPQIENSQFVSDVMDTITGNLVHFFNTQTFPDISVNADSIVLIENSKIRSLDIQIDRGELFLIDVSGGVKISGNRTEDKIIWFENEKMKQISVFAVNKFDSWNFKTFNVEGVSNN